MSGKWIQHYCYKLSLDPNSREFVMIRISTPPDETCVITDIRKYRGNRALPVGVSLLPSELDCIFKLIEQNSSGRTEKNMRIVEANFNGSREITVLKPDGSLQMIQLESDEIDILCQQKDTVFKILAEQMQQLHSKVPHDIDMQ